LGPLASGTSQPEPPDRAGLLACVRPNQDAIGGSGARGRESLEHRGRLRASQRGGGLGPVRGPSVGCLAPTPHPGAPGPRVSGSDPARRHRDRNKGAASPDLIPLTLPEVRRLLRVLTEPIDQYGFHRHWSWWRRMHQAVARRGHIAARARARPAPCRPARAVAEPNTVAPPSWTELTDGQWRRVQPLLLARSSLGRPPSEPRLVLAGLLWILHRHASWRELPTTFGPWRTISGHYRLWRQTGLWPVLLRALYNPQPPSPEVSL
jgi:hypothetical protein